MFHVPALRDRSDLGDESDQCEVIGWAAKSHDAVEELKLWNLHSGALRERFCSSANGCSRSLVFECCWISRDEVAVRGVSIWGVM